MTNEIVLPATVPNSYHSSQTDTITKSDTHRSSEQTIHTETCRITETTMRMEHKSPLPDIEFNPSPRPFEINANSDIHTKQYMDHTDHSKHMINTNPVPQYQHPQSSPNRTEYDHFTDTETLKKQTYNTYEIANQNQRQMAENLHPNNNVGLIDEPAAKTGHGSVSERVKLIDKCVSVDSTYKPFKSVPNDFPFAQCNLDNQYENSNNITTPIHQNGKTTPNQLNETIEEFSSKMHEFQQSHWSNNDDLKAPALVNQIIKPNVAQLNEQQQPICAPLHLKPGEPVEYCFAPRVLSDKKPSLLEQMEKTLEKDATKVLPYSIRMIPPSPPPPTISEHFDSSKHIIKQSKQYDINQPNKNLNHIKNTFYENITTPLQRNTIVHVPTPTKTPEKVRIPVCLCICVCTLTKINRFVNQPITNN